MPILKQAKNILLYQLLTNECARRDQLLVCLFEVIMAKCLILVISSTNRYIVEYGRTDVVVGID